MTETCDICQGARTVKLVVHREVKCDTLDKMIIEDDISGREYPCPACSQPQGLQVLSIRQMVSRVDEERMADYPGFKASIQSRACRSLAERLIADTSIYRKIEPKAGEFNYPHVIHQWSIAVASKLSEVEAREKQMDESRREGMREAAMILRKIVPTYDRADGMCKHVLIHQLESMATAIERASVS